MAEILDFNDAAPGRNVALDWEKRVEKLRTELPARAGELVRDLFPLAQLTAHEARIGNVDGEPGESLSIGLSGERAGLWYDHATGEGGDLIQLWQRVTRSVDFGKVVEDLERWGGWSNAPRWTSNVVKLSEERKRVAATQPRPTQTLGEPVATWTYTDAAGAVLATVKRFDIAGQVDANGKQKKTFRPFLPNGTAGMPEPRPLYRQPDLLDAQRVILVEGEKCADALAAVGIPTTTQMGGASANPDKTDWSPLAGKHVVIWPDNDAPGQEMVTKLRPTIEAIAASVAVLTVPPGKPPKWDAADAVAEGFDVATFVAAPAAERPLIPIYTRRQLRNLKRPEWLIDEILVESSVIALYGPSGSLKSFVAIDMAMCVANGVPWHGRDVKQGPVVYVTGEGRDQINNRLEAWERANGITNDDMPFITIPLGVAISDPTWVGHLIAAIQAATATPPAMIWLDTLARTFGAGDENSQKDMNAFIAGMDRLRDAFRSLIGVVHHTGKEDSKGLRGSSALYAAMDTVIRSERGAGKMLVTLKNAQPHGKQKDAAEFDDIALEAKIIGLGFHDNKGREVTSLALSLAEKPTSPPELEADERLPVERAPKPQGANQKAIDAALRKAKRPLGLVSLKAILRTDNSGPVLQALSAMVAKGLVLELGNEGAKQWDLA